MKNSLRFGFGAIVTDDPDLPWVKTRDYLEMLDVFTKKFSVGYLDTAQAYDQCEVVLGQWLAQQSSEFKARLTIGSKVSGRSHRSQPRQSLTREYVLKIAKESLAKLQLESMDVYWLHSPDPTVPLAESIEGLHQIVREGLAMSYGVSNVSPDEIKAVLKLCQDNHWERPKYVQNQFNLLHHIPEFETLQICQQEGFHFMAYSPLASGTLSGKYAWNQALPSGSRWESWEKVRGLPGYWNEKTFLGIERLRHWAEKKNISLPGLALAWVSSFPGIGTVLLGPRHQGHLPPIEEAMKTRLNPDELEQLQNIFA